MNGSSLNSDGQQFNQYQQNNQSPLTFNLLSEHTHTKQSPLTFNLLSEHTHKTIPSHL